MRRIIFLLALLPLGCASSPEPTETRAAAADAPVEQVDPTFVAFSRLSPIYLEPDESAPHLVFRTEEEQAERLEEMARKREAVEERLLKRAERDAEREERRAKRVRKRMRRLRGERRERYREKEEERALKRARDKAEEAIERVVDWSRDHPGEAPHEHVIIAQLVEERGDWVAIRPVRHDTPRCYAGAAPALSNLDATLWVRRSALYSVVTDRTRVSVAHGTEVILAPGVAVDETSSGPRALVNGFELGLDIPADALSHTYEVGHAFEAPYTETVFSPHAYSDRLLRLSKDAALPYNPWYPLHVTATLWVGDRFYATTQTPCAEFTVRTVEEALEPVGERGAMRVGGAETVEVTPPMIVAGAELFTPNGDPIGQARTDIAVIDEVENEAGLECWHFEVWPGDEGSRRLPICSKKDDFRGLRLTEGL